MALELQAAERRLERASLDAGGIEQVNAGAVAAAAMTLLQREEERDEEALKSFEDSKNFEEFVALIENPFKERSKVICSELAVGLALAGSGSSGGVSSRLASSEPAPVAASSWDSHVSSTRRMASTCFWGWRNRHRCCWGGGRHGTSTKLTCGRGRRGCERGTTCWLCSPRLTSSRTSSGRQSQLSYTHGRRP